MSAQTAWQECAQKKPGTCKEWRQLVSEGEYVHVCYLLCACAQCHVKLSVWKKACYKYTNGFRFHVQGGAAGQVIHISITPLLCVSQWKFLHHVLLTINSFEDIYHQPICSCMVKRVFAYCMCEKKRNLLCSPAVILSKNKTNTLPLPSNHPPCSANIQAKLHSVACLCKRHTHSLSAAW